MELAVAMFPAVALDCNVQCQQVLWKKEQTRKRTESKKKGRRKTEERQKKDRRKTEERQKKDRSKTEERKKREDRRQWRMH